MQVVQRDDKVYPCRYCGARGTYHDDGDKSQCPQSAGPHMPRWS